MRGWISANWRALLGLLVGAHATMLLGNALSTPVAPYLGIGVMVCLLSIWNGRSGNNAQDFFGRASYHLFIGHMPIAAVLVTGLKLRQASVSVFLAAIVAALVLSALVVPMERNLNIIPQRIAQIAQERIERRL